MRVLLVEPPQADPAQPYSSLAVLLASWRRAGLDVAVEDLNVDFFNYLCRPDNVRESLNEISRRLSAGAFRDDREEEAFLRAGAFGEALETELPAALSVLKNADLFYQPRVYAWAIRYLYRALETISAPFYPGRITLQSFKTAQSCHSSAGILAAAQDGATNMFIRYCDDVVRRKLLAHRPDVLAVSVTFQTQLIPAWTLAARARRWLPGIKVVFGGATISRVKESLRKLPHLHRDVDAFILFEGETAFPALLQEWEEGREGLAAPNVLMLTSNGIASSPRIHTEDMNELPPPDHAGLPLEEYWWPEPALLINSSRGCYYGRCAFCMISPATWGPDRMGKAYRLRSTARVIDDLIFAHDQTGARAFNLANDILPPRALFEIGEGLRERDLSFTWDSEIRLDRGLSRKVLQAMADGGCRHLRFGFETASERVGKLMDKGTDLRVTERILADCKDVGITVSLLCQVGFPGETIDEAHETLDFLRRSNDRVGCVSLTQFSLERGSVVHQQPEKFGVTIRPLPPSEDLAWSYDYTRADGIDVEQTSVLFEEAEATIDESYPDRDLFFKGGLGHAHTTLYTRRYSPQVFARWNQRPQRIPAPLENGVILRLSEGLSFKPQQHASPDGWTRFTVASAEVPELAASIDGSALLVLMAGREPTPVETIIAWVQYLSDNRYSDDEAVDLVNSLYEAGLFLSANADDRSVVLA